MDKLWIYILVYNLALCIITELIMVFKPRLFLGDYPNRIQKMVIPKTTEENKLSMVTGLVFLAVYTGLPTFFILTQTFSENLLVIFATSFLFFISFNIVDLLVLDYLIFVKWTPSFLVLEGTENHPAYKDMMTHYDGFLKGTLFSILLSALIVGINLLIKIQKVWRYSLQKKKSSELYKKEPF